MNCPTCSAQMKPLFSGVFCPNDCDRPKPAPEKRNDDEFFLKLERKVSFDFRRNARAWLTGPIMPSTVWYLCAKHDGSFTIESSLRQKEAHDNILRSDWVLSINGEGVINVVKNRYGKFDSIDDIPDWGSDE